MTRTSLDLECPVFDSFRVQQIAGMFDVPVGDKLRQRIEFERPPLDEPWQIGLIVGPSGSGKTTVAGQLFGEQVYRAGDWPADRAVIDGFGDMPTRDITRLLVAVGFSSPPSWIKPYAVLSGGEKFRCDLARALAAGAAESREPKAESRASDGTSPTSACADFRSPLSALPTVAFDEFTSVVDRNVARVGSAAVACAIRRGQVRVRFVAISCHYDIARWLEPDWVLDMARGTVSRNTVDRNAVDANLDRRRLRRPPVRLELFRCHHAAWQLFARHHYLSGSLSRSARCFLATWEETPVGFCATLPVIGRRDHWRITRLVTLPDYQGIGIGMQLAEAVAELHAAAGQRLNVTASHPGLLLHCQRSPRWRTARVLRTGSRRSGAYRPNYFGSPGRAVVSFEFVGGSQLSAEDNEVRS